MLSVQRLQYTVQPNDFLIKIGACFGVSARVIARDNGLRYEGYIYPDQKLWIDSRHIVPPMLGEAAQSGSAQRNDAQADGLYINLPQRMLYLIRGGQL